MLAMPFVNSSVSLVMSLAADVGLCHAPDHGKRTPCVTTPINGCEEEHIFHPYFFVCVFFQELLESAYTLYNEMVFVTLDIDEFAHWASRFVPRDYHAKHAFGKTPFSFSEFESLWLDLA